MSELARHSPQLDIRDFCRISTSELARHSPQLDIRDFCRMSMSEFAGHSSQLDIRDFCRMSMSELAGYSPQFEIRISNVDVSSNFTHLKRCVKTIVIEKFLSPIYFVDDYGRVCDNVKVKM
ncbi:hypothetical protein DPMN_168140 [Dreissena polymorpha]|uniref:Uncharacterized protein n=1 Tax=Dreissena polymorpha TaxID=45954 RepID=A0A9D4IZD6_DREPO|nr:hypothetical protein DPMN_168140 [Dreissena polymorpha]